MSSVMSSITASDVSIMTDSEIQTILQPTPRSLNKGRKKLIKNFLLRSLNLKKPEQTLAIVK